MSGNRSPERDAVLVLACGALARELKAVIDVNHLSNIVVECLPAALHNRPADIPGAIRARLPAAKAEYGRVLIGYADCGTGGELDRICDEEAVERLPGPHCYQFFAGTDRFTTMHAADPAAFYLTDFLARHFDRLILDGLGITAHPELEAVYFGNYTKVVYLAQTDDPALDAAARAAAERLGLEYERVATGYGELETTMVAFAETST